jgi:hypothetical protein
MHRRPSLNEAISVLNSVKHVSEEAEQALNEYYSLKNSGQEFLAARLVVEIVDFFYHATGVQANG